MVNVYDDMNNVIAKVKYNNDLDVWNGRNFQNGGVGRHLGITKIKKNDKELYVLIHGSDWQGSNDYGVIISKEKAFKLIMKYNESLLEEDKFKDLNEFKEDLFVEIE